MGFWERWRQRLDAAVPEIPVDDGEDHPHPDPSRPATTSDAPPDDTLLPHEAVAEREAVVPHGSEAAALPQQPEHVVRPVTRDRIAESMRRKSYRFLVDEDGNLSGLWAYRFFSFYLVRGGVLQIRGRWTRQANISRLWEILAFADRWNATHPHPKCYVRVQDDGHIHVITEVAVPVAAGLTDVQLDHHIAVGLAAGTAVFDELDRQYPDPVLQADDQ